MGAKIQSFVVNDVWYGHHPVRWLLWPLAFLYRGLTWVRRCYLQSFVQAQSPVPIIVVGNLTVGGVGKTPLVIALAKGLQAKGLRVGIVSRGYGASVKHFPYEVRSDASSLLVGDEPLLIAKKTLCPVVIAPKRLDAVNHLLKHHPCDVIISDDGLQHYAMSRTIEIVVMDSRGFGNGLCLPAGPMRESVRRLKDVDFVVMNGPSDAPKDVEKVYRMDLVPGSLKQLLDDKEVCVSDMVQPVAAVAGIGHPARFFSTLKALGLSMHTYAFDDHHRFHQKDLDVSEASLVMTEKDAVKCHAFATPAMYYLPVEATIENAFWDVLLRILG